MGKKDELINVLKIERDGLRRSVKDLATQKAEAVRSNEKLIQANRTLTDSLQKVKELGDVQIRQLQTKIVEITEHKSLMITTVNIAGVADITKTLNDAVTLLEDRLDVLGLKDKYTILAVPHTMSIGIVR